MPPRQTTTGYERLAQADQHSDSEEEDFLAQSFASLQHGTTTNRYTSQPAPRGAASNVTSPRRGASRLHPHRRHGSSGAGVDLKAMNARLERWADEIAARFKGSHRNRPGEEQRLEIHHSVFQAPEGVIPITPDKLAEVQPVMKQDEFEVIVNSVRRAIDRNVHPLMISQGSSGSYFARNPDGKVVGVFKPKDEEPYAAGNPKWNKWIHRNLFPCFFGRACLIPNLSYVSEAAAYTLDCQLRTHMVPYTDVVYLSSKSFHYPFWDRHSFYRKKKPLPEKPGSFQVFLKGFKDANIFLRENPWPDQYWSGFRTRDGTRRSQTPRWTDSCRPSGSRQLEEQAESQDIDPESQPLGPDNFRWTDALKQSFREELEKLVILDYIMRNTDRGLDNWMVKVDWSTQQVSIQSEPMNFNITSDSEDDNEDEDGNEATPGPRPADPSRIKNPSAQRASNPYKAQNPMEADATPTATPKITIGAIDNSLSWPWKHPDAWRSFPFGWLFLPVDLIGRPFSQKTRDHFLPLLTSTHWWSQTQYALRKVFQMDEDFQERMFAKQMAVMKGQAWNVVETLKTPDHGPLELTRRAKVCVWDDLVDVPVAVPMRSTSSEIHRRQKSAGLDDFDISGAHPEPDLLGLGSPSEMPNPGRFELATSPPPSTSSPRPDQQQQQQSTVPNYTRYGPQPYQARLNMYSPDRHGSSSTAPPPPASTAAPPASARANSHQRRYSYATAATRKTTNSIAHQLYGGLDGYEDDDIEGDLGYAAAQGMEGQMRKVIVERLEPVKSRNPVFTWC